MAPARSELHEHLPVVPDLIREYIQEVQACLQLITTSGAEGVMLHILACRLTAEGEQLAVYC